MKEREREGGGVKRDVERSRKRWRQRIKKGNDIESEK